MPINLWVHQVADSRNTRTPAARYEIFTVNLSGASGATIFDGQGVGTILNDD